MFPLFSVKNGNVPIVPSKKPETFPLFPEGNRVPGVDIADLRQLRMQSTVIMRFFGDFCLSRPNNLHFNEILAHELVQAQSWEAENVL